ncbi:molybdenum cofactor guanylyltransferase [Hyperthermus butylicus]|uniref:molybdenum cofactor guanylyltransferase n=1 Tax=Hyperthermus butylicus TaxID=54248 RepID=UPI00189121C9|nr:NTP transferase domain-containing protein [Hyperthermus butylicus]
MVLFNAYILAGGEGRRFGGDKLAALVDSVASIARLADAAWRAGAAAVYAVTRSVERCRTYMSLAKLTSCLYDEPPLPGCEGPAVAIYTALRHAAEAGARAVILPGDAPWLTWLQVWSLQAYGLGVADAATIIHGDGYLESLVQAYNPDAAARAARAITGWCKVRGYARATDPLRAQPTIALIGSGLTAYTATAYAHINTREVIRTRQPKNPLSNSTVIIVEAGVAPDNPSMCWLLCRELETYTLHGIEQLARQARQDFEVLCSKDK